MYFFLCGIMNLTYPLPIVVHIFYKAHVMAGQVQFKPVNALDYPWPTKEEVEGELLNET
jgi:hypothetical protein